MYGMERENCVMKFTAYRITEDSEYWLRACVYYIRIDEFAREYDVGVAHELDENDSPRTPYILVLDEKGNPASTCRLRYLDETTGKIERVSTIKEMRGTGAGSAAIHAAEDWMRENGVRRIVINSRDTAIGFYEKLGYVTDWDSHQTGKSKEPGADHAQKPPFVSPEHASGFRTPDFGVVNTYKDLNIE